MLNPISGEEVETPLWIAWPGALLSHSFMILILFAVWKWKIEDLTPLKLGYWNLWAIGILFRLVLGIIKKPLPS